MIHNHETRHSTTRQRISFRMTKESHSMGECSKERGRDYKLVVETAAIKVTPRPTASNPRPLGISLRAIAFSCRSFSARSPGRRLTTLVQLSRRSYYLAETYFSQGNYFHEVSYFVGDAGTEWRRRCFSIFDLSSLPKERRTGRRKRVCAKTVYPRVDYARRS